jgi:hypothetical protein
MGQEVGVLVLVLVGVMLAVEVREMESVTLLVRLSVPVALTVGVTEREKDVVGEGVDVVLAVTLYDFVAPPGREGCAVLEALLAVALAIIEPVPEPVREALRVPEAQALAERENTVPVTVGVKLGLELLLALMTMEGEAAALLDLVRETVKEGEAELERHRDTEKVAVGEDVEERHRDTLAVEEGVCALGVMLRLTVVVEVLLESRERVTVCEEVWEGEVVVDWEVEVDPPPRCPPEGEERGLKETV